MARIGGHRRTDRLMQTTLWVTAGGGTLTLIGAVGEMEVLQWAGIGLLGLALGLLVCASCAVYIRRDKDPRQLARIRAGEIYPQHPEYGKDRPPR
jgi:hypothetical protein